jgi:hypothetical protein
LFYEFAIALGHYDGKLSFGIDVGHLGGGEWADNPHVYVNADTGEYGIGSDKFGEFVPQDDTIDA